MPLFACMVMPNFDFFCKLLQTTEVHAPIIMVLNSQHEICTIVLHKPLTTILTTFSNFSTKMRNIEKKKFLCIFWCKEQRNYRRNEVMGHLFFYKKFLLWLFIGYDAPILRSDQYYPALSLQSSSVVKLEDGQEAHEIALCSCTSSPCAPLYIISLLA